MTQLLCQHGIRPFSKKDDETDDKYSKQFQDLLGKSSRKLTAEEEQELERKEEEKFKRAQEASQQDSIKQEKYKEQKK